MEKTVTKQEDNHDLKNISPLSQVSLSPVSPDYICRALLRVSPNMILLTRLGDGEIYDASDIFCQTTGFSRKEIIGKTTVHLGLWPAQERRKMVKILLQDGEFRNMEMMQRKKDGAALTCLNSGALIQSGDERYALKVSVDVTEKKQMESRLLDTQTFNEAIISSLPGLFYVVDQNFRFIQWNKNFPCITGYAPGELQKMQVLDLYPEEMRDSIAKEIKKVFQKGEYSAEAEMRLKGGGCKTYLFNSKCFCYQGKPCVIGVATDITDMKQAEKELKQFAKSLEDANITMSVLMEHKDRAQKDTEAILQANINELVMPYLKNLQKISSDDHIVAYLKDLENNLRQALSPFMKNFLSYHKNLTAQEIHIADLIKKGKKTSEIALILNSSAKTVATHRNNIRKKLKLVRSKTNLRSYLQSSGKQEI